MSEQPTRIDASLLPKLHALAAKLDPPHANAYATMPLGRWREGAAVAAQLLLEHHIYLFHLHAGYGHVHRDAHRRAVSVLLNAARESDLVAGLSVLVVASEHLNGAHEEFPP